MCAGMLLNICSVGEGGRNASEGGRRKTFRREVPEFAERMWYLEPGTVGEVKLGERWGDGLDLRIIEESSEICIGTRDGILKARTFARREGEDRWWRNAIDVMVVVPWEPIPGKGMQKLKSRARIAGAGAGEDIIAEQQMKKAMPRRMRFDIDDFDKYGFALGCPGCKATIEAKLE